MGDKTKPQLIEQIKELETKLAEQGVTIGDLQASSGPDEGLTLQIDQLTEDKATLETTLEEVTEALGTSAATVEMTQAENTALRQSIKDLKSRLPEDEKDCNACISMGKTPKKGGECWKCTSRDKFKAKK